MTDQAKWYNCARCDAGYDSGPLEQGCTCAEDLARRAVACKGWRWMPGMLAIHPNWRGYRVSHVGLTGMHGACRYASPMGGVEWAVVPLPVPTSSDVLPDLTDPATLGCLLALVREAWGDPALSVTAGYGKDRKVEWDVEHPHPDSLPEALWTYFDTEAEALVAALEMSHE